MAAFAENRLVCFGDSITEGWMVGPDESWPALVAGRIDAEVINAGISGETSADAVRRLDNITGLRPTSCTVEFGINDFFNGFTIEQTRANIEHIINRLQQNGVRVGLIGFSLPQYNTVHWEDMYSKIAEAFGTALMADIFKGLREETGTFMPDGVHPTAKGYEIIAGNCLKAFQGRLW